MRDLRTFRIAGRPRRIDQIRKIVPAGERWRVLRDRSGDRELDRRGPVRQHITIPRLADHGARAAVAQDVGHTLRRVRRIDRNVGRTRLEHGQDGEHELLGAVEQNRDPIPRSHPVDSDASRRARTLARAFSSRYVVVRSPQTSAIASGVRAAWASSRATIVPSDAAGPGAPPQAASCADSACGQPTRIAPTMVCGSAAMHAIAVSKWPAIRATCASPYAAPSSSNLTCSSSRGTTTRLNA